MRYFTTADRRAWENNQTLVHTLLQAILNDDRPRVRQLLRADGELVPVNGQIDLFLLGEIERATGVVGNPTLPQFRELERGSQLVKTGDFARGAAMYQLPFRQFHPDFYFDVARQALVNARLGVPGQGLFMASDANVQLRGFSRIRDELQMKTPQRFFPTENAFERPGIMLPQY